MPEAWNLRSLRERYALATRAPRPDRHFESRWTRVRGLRLHCRASRHSPDTAPVVLVHGVAVSHRYLMPFAELLAAEHPVLAVDLPGFGLSDKPRTVAGLPELTDHLADWLTATGNAPAAVFGNSFGAQIAVDLAVRHPDLADRLILSGPTMDPAARTMTRQVLRWLRSLPHEDPSQVPILARDLLDAGPYRAVRTFRTALRDRIEDKLPRVHVPTLVTRGDREAVATQAWAERAVALLPEGRLAVVPNCPHDATYSAPAALTELVLPFLGPAAPLTGRTRETGGAD